jgi:23S rRNA (cytosine1962-C5)-methyltransferase
MDTKAKAKNSQDPPGQWLPRTALESFQTQGTSAHRVYSAPNIWIERYDNDFIVSYKNRHEFEALLPEFHDWARVNNLSICRIFRRLLVKASGERNAPVLEFGPQDLPREIIVTEHSIRYGIDFAAGYSTGLFLDQRLNRQLVRTRPARKLLNCFAYTCSFSVCAALGGAHTVSVDLSNRSLERGKKNFQLNQINPGNHRFIADDVFEVIPYLRRKGQRFDAIILDPPTFSRGNKGATFHAKKDFEKLLLLALEVAEPKARILLSTNCSTMTNRDLQALAQYALKIDRLSGITEPGRPLVDIPPQMAAATLWLQIR